MLILLINTENLRKTSVLNALCAECTQRLRCTSSGIVLTPANFGKIYSKLYKFVTDNIDSEFCVVWFRLQS